MNARVVLPWTYRLATLALAAGALAWWTRLRAPEEATRVPVPVPAPPWSPMAAGETRRLEHDPPLPPVVLDPDGLSAAWPGFRGPRRDQTADGGATAGWGAEGVEAVWRVRLANGHAGAAVGHGSVYIADHFAPGAFADGWPEADGVRCFDLATGRERWRYAFPLAVRPDHGLSRAVPALSADGGVFALGPMGHVVALDAATGAERWRVDVVARYDLERPPPWYAAQCPFVDGDRLVLAPGGSMLFAALDTRTGETVWRTPNTLGRPLPKTRAGRVLWADMTHASVTALRAPGADGGEGETHYVYPFACGLVGVRAADGALAWHAPDWQVPTATAPSAVDAGGGRVLVAGGYGAGARLYRLVRSADADAGAGGAAEAGGPAAPARLPWRAEEVWRTPASAFDTTQHTPLLRDGRLYAVASDGALACVRAADGALLWRRREEAHRSGAGGGMLWLDGALWVVRDQASTLLRYTWPDADRDRAPTPAWAFRFADGAEAWAPLAWADGWLLARDETGLVALRPAAR